MQLAGLSTSSWLANFVIQPRTLCPGDDAAQSGLDVSTSFTDVHMGQYDLGNPSMEINVSSNSRLYQLNC